MIETLDGAEEDQLLTADQAAKFLAISPETMRSWRKAAQRRGPDFIKVEQLVRYPLQALRTWLSERTVRTEGPRRNAPFYRQTRIEELGAKHPGLCELVEGRLRRRVPYREIAAAIFKQWGERITEQSIRNFYVLRVWPKILDEERSQVSSR